MILVDEKGFIPAVDLEIENGFALVLAVPVELVLKMESPRLGEGDGNLRDSSCVRILSLWAGVWGKEADIFVPLMAFMEPGFLRQGLFLHVKT